MSCEAQPSEEQGRSELQENWENIGIRLRIQIEATLAAVEKEASKADSCLLASTLEQLAGAAAHAFFLERHSQTMDVDIRRQAGGW